MGFFSDLKEDLAMAVNELMPDDTEDVIRTTDKVAETDDIVSDEVAKEDIQVSMEDFELDKMLEDLEALDVQASQEEVVEAEIEEMVDADIEEVTEAEIEEAVESEMEELIEAAIEETVETELEEVEEAVIEEAVADELDKILDAEIDEILSTENEEAMEAEVEETAILTALAQEEKNTQDEGAEKKMETMTNRVASDETAVITQGMVITGDIISEGSVDVIGTINGNIDILGKLNVTGSIQGNSKASEIFADNAKINGEVVADGSIKIGQSSIIIGNITATSAVIAGAVKGDIDVQGPVILDTSAIVMGNIKSKSVQINNGAVIEGMCSQCYADVNPTSFFEELNNNK